MTTPQIDLSALYEPHAVQQRVHQAEAKVKVLCMGRRLGKSRAALWEGVLAYLEALKVEAPVSLAPPFHAWVVCPSYPQARQTWSELLTYLPSQFIQPNGIHQDEQFIYLRGSDQRAWGLLEVKSAAAPESLQTVGLDFLWVQEAQDVSDLAFEKLLPTLRSPNRMGRAVLEGIPPLHSDHWFYRMIVLAERGTPGYFYLHATSFDNPLLSSQEIAEIEADREILRDSAWRRMYLAEFQESAGYFQNIQACIAGDLLPVPIPGVRYVAGLDLGRRHDASVLTIGEAQGRRVRAHRRWDAGQSWVIQRESVAHECQVWGVERLMVDSTGLGDVVVDELINMGLPVEPFQITTNSREILLNTLAVALERSTVSFPPVPELLRELRAFQHRKTAGGSWKAEAPPGEHDDEVFALCLMLQACDPAQELVAGGKLTSRLYLPREGESTGQRILRERFRDRMRQRIEAAGVRE